MTTSLVNAAIQQTDDATFRAWVKQVIDQLVAVGLVKTADTGQIDTATVLRPTAGNTSAGYAIFAFPTTDTLQATRPVVFKLEFGSFGTVSLPSMWLTVGAGSDGAGAITGISHARVQIGRNLAPGTAVNNSYAVLVPALGFFGFHGWNASGVTTTPFGQFFLSIARPTDDAAAPLGDGLSMMYNNATQLLQTTYSYTDAKTINVNTRDFCHIPSGLISGTVGTDVQLFRHFCATPRVRNLPQTVTYLSADIGKGASFTATLVGATARTYMPFGDGLQAASANNRTADVLAMLWE